MKFVLDLPSSYFWLAADGATDFSCDLMIVAHSWCAVYNTRYLDIIQ